MSVVAVPNLPSGLPPITPDQRAEVQRLRDEERLSWARIASIMGRREETLRNWYNRDRAEAEIAALKGRAA